MGTGLGHAGDLTPQEASDLLKRDSKAVLIDVRTEPEWEDIGVPDGSAMEQKPIFLEYLTAPSMTLNPDFVQRLSDELASRGADTASPLLFLCRSGARSNAAAAAMTALGFTQCHNIVGGFEGSPGQGLPGWKQSGLPWTR